MQRIFEAFERAGKELFLVGGAVRELARGVEMVEIDDLDFCTDARPQQTLAILRGAGLVTYDVGIEFGTVGTMLYSDTEPGYPKDCQITTYRSAEYYQRTSRHPQVQYGDTLEQDLKRRDFSINSIAMRADGEYVDPYDGIGDLHRGIIRVVGDPHETLAEDPLRMLRVGRFIAKLGFHADAELEHACGVCAPRIMDISRERWLQEMTKLVRGPHADQGLTFLYDVGVLALILGEVSGLVAHKTRWERTLLMLMKSPVDAGVRWAALLHDIGAPGEAGAARRREAIDAITTRFKFDRATAIEVREVAMLHERALEYAESWSDAQVRRLVRALDPHLEGAVALARARLASGNPAERGARLSALEDFERRVRELDEARALRPALPSGMGNAMMRAFELEPGRVIGQIKQALEERMLDGELPMEGAADIYIEALRRSPPAELAAAMEQGASEGGSQ